MDTGSFKAFISIVEHGSMSKAAINIGLTQPALSLKISRIEENLKTSLFIRKNKKLFLTPAGEDFLIFSRSMINQYENFLSEYDQFQNELSGRYRIAGFSSIMRSLLIPGLKNLMLKNPKINLEFNSFEVVDLVDVLKSSRADIIVLDYHPNLNKVEEVVIGEEEYVEIVSSKHKKVEDIYFDHGAHDNATESFFNFQGMSFNKKRGFMGDVYGILDAVEYGLGKAIMSKHLVENNKKFKIIRHKNKYKRPLVMCYLKQDYYSPLHHKILESLVEI